MKTKKMDYLAEKIMDALNKTDMDRVWLYSKGERLAGMNRYEILEEMRSFDVENTAAICAEIGCNVEDIEATLRVLRAIYNM